MFTSLDDLGSCADVTLSSFLHVNYEMLPVMLVYSTSFFVLSSVQDKGSIFLYIEILNSTIC